MIKNFYKFLKVKNLTDVTRDGPFFLLIFTSIAYSYFGIWNTFFVADVWHNLNSYILIPDYGISYFFQLFAIPNGIHFLPLGVVFSTIQTYLFGVNATWYGLTALGLHFINCAVIFLIVKSFTKNRFIALMSALFFATNYQIREGLFWYVSNIWTQTSTVLFLIALYYLTVFIQTKRRKDIFLSLIFSMIALYFREYGFMIIPFSISVLGFIMLFKRRQDFLKYFPIFLYGAIGIVAYIVIRIVLQVSSSSQIVHASKIPSDGFIFFAIWNAITMPARVLSNILVPERAILDFSYAASKYVYFQLSVAQSDVFTTVLFYDQIHMFFGMLLLTALLILGLQAVLFKKKKIVPLVVFGSSFLLIPFVFNSLTEYRFWIFSRYLYLPTAILSIYFFIFLSRYKVFLNKNFISVPVYLVIILYILLNAYLTKNFISDFVQIGTLRKSLLHYVYERLDFDKKNQIIFITDGKTMNGVEGDILPFQTHFGKVLFTWSYYQHDNNKRIPRCLYDPYFLYAHYNEYKSCEGKGFGYFHDINRLQDTVIKENINPEDISAFSFNTATNTIEDISIRLRKDLFAK